MLIRRIARPMLSAVFIVRGIEALRNPEPAADAAQPAIEGLSRLPDPIGSNVPSNTETVARVNAAVQIGCGLLLAGGIVPRAASAALALTVLPGSLGRQTFWTEIDSQRKADQRREFATDVSLIGALLIAAADTAGRPSLGWRGRRAAHQVSEAVTAVLPDGESHPDSAVAARIEDALHAGAERGRELAHLARERTVDLAETARAEANKKVKKANKKARKQAKKRVP